MKPIFTVIISIFVTILLSCLIVFGFGYAGINKDKAKFSEADLAMATKTVTFKTPLEKLYVATGIDAEYQVQDVEEIKVIVNCPKAGMEKLKIENEDGELHLYFENKTKKFLKKDAHATIIAPAAPEIKVTSGADVKTKGKYLDLTSVEISSGANLKIDSIYTKNVEIDLSSGASGQLNYCYVDTLEAEASSGASLRLGGKEAGYIEYEASSGADIDAEKLKALTGKAHASSGASISCDVKTLNSSTSSGGIISNNN